MWRNPPGAMAIWVDQRARGSYDGATNRGLVEKAGLEIVSAQEETLDEDGTPVTFLWVVATNPRP